MAITLASLEDILIDLDCGGQASDVAAMNVKLCCFLSPENSCSEGEAHGRDAIKSQALQGFLKKTFARHSFRRHRSLAHGTQEDER